MSETVFNIIQTSFLKAKPNQDVNQLAASRIAIDLLGEALKELNKYKDDTQKDNKELNQVGM